MDRRQDWRADSRHLGDGEMALNIHACHSPHAERVTLCSSLSLSLSLSFFFFLAHTDSHAHHSIYSHLF